MGIGERGTPGNTRQRACAQPRQSDERGIVPSHKGEDMNEEDAFNYLVSWLRNPRPTPFGSFGYGFYLPNVIRLYLEEHEGLQHPQGEQLVRELSPVFYAAAWELCRFGVLRPGLAIYGGQATPDGSSGNGYTITPYGERWLAGTVEDDFVPTEPGRFASLLHPFRELFGVGFAERAQQAVLCYRAHAYLACCAMCGAAAESILLALAIKKTDEDEVLRSYASSGGRGRIEALVLANASEPVKRSFRGYTDLLKYWRDETAHGRVSQIGPDEAYVSLLTLLRLAQFARDHR